MESVGHSPVPTQQVHVQTRTPTSPARLLLLHKEFDWFSSQRDLARSTDAGSGRPGSPHTGSFCLVSAPAQTTNNTHVLFVSLRKHLGEVARTAPVRPRGNDRFLRFPRAWPGGGFCIEPTRPPTLPRHPITGVLYPGSLVGSYAANQSGPKSLPPKLKQTTSQHMI